jgi:hypothetical protein
MKRACLFLLSCCSFMAIAQTSNTVQVTTAGTLHNLISQTIADTLMNLTVTGSIDARDIAFIRDKVKRLTTLNLQGATIVAYTGTEGTNTDIETVYPAGELPKYALYNPYLQTYKYNLTSLKLPGNLVSIGELACYYCWNLTGQLSIPATVKSISDYAFYGCSELTAFSVSASNTRYSGSNGVLFSKNKDTLFLFPNAKSGDYVIPSTVTRINCSAFENASSLSSVTIPASVISIGKYAFCNCSGIKGNLTLPESLISLEDGVFYNCDNLNGTVYIPATLKQMGYYCFLESNSIKMFSVNSSSTSYSSNNGILYSKNQDTLFICPGGKKGSIMIPSTVKLIGSHAFYNCDSLTGNIQIPLNVDYIGYYAFYGCKKIASFTVDTQNAYFTSVDNVLYTKTLDRILACPSIKNGSFTLPESIRYIDPCAFCFCTSLSGFINIPASVEYLGDYAFYGCKAISGFTVDSDNKFFSAQDGLLFNKWKDTLYICPLSKSGQFQIPSSVKYIGHSAFDGCSNLTEIYLPDSIEGIGNYAFKDCTGLTGFSIPPNVTKFGYCIFYNCTGIADMFVEKSVPPVVDYYFFEGINKTTCKLTVPKNTGFLYKDAPYWEDFSNIIEKDFGSKLDLVDNQSSKVYIQQDKLIIEEVVSGKSLYVITLDGRYICRKLTTGETISISLPCKGFYLIRYGDISTKIIY